MCFIHDWGSWQKPKNSTSASYRNFLYQLRKCKRCGKVGNRTVMEATHEFTPDEDL